MAKLNLVLLVVLAACALGLVTSQNRVRILHAHLERAQQHERDLEVEYGRLQLESATWGLPSRVEKIAKGTLGMHVPDPRQVRVVVIGADAHAGGTK